MLFSYEELTRMVRTAQKLGYPVCLRVHDITIIGLDQSKTDENGDYPEVIAFLELAGVET